MKKHNPQTPIMMREAAGTQPRVYARYGMTGHLQTHCVGSLDKRVRLTRSVPLNSFRPGEAGSVVR